MRAILIAASLNVVSLLAAAPNPTAPKAFSIQSHDGVDWLHRPNGERFFSFGVCVVNTGVSKQDYQPTNPAYATWQHYPDSNQWAKATVQRLKSWGFTTIGGWSDFAAVQQRPESQMAMTPVLHVGSTAGVPWWDMWDPKIIERMHQIARDQILPLRDDSRLLGYYTDNEMGWWNGMLFKMTLEHAPTSGQRRRLLQLLREIYHDDWSELLQDFEPENAQSFEQLEQRGMLFLRPGSNGMRTLRRFLALMAERYYSLVRQIIRAYDQRALILGDRYQSFYYPEVVRACGPEVDAVSANLNAAWNDGTFPRFYLDTLHALAARPILVSEFYMCARQNRSGNRNDKGIFPVVATQRQRVTAFNTTLRRLAQHPHVIGADWFQYYDEPTHGRGDGENFNFGLVDIHDAPYTALTAAAGALDLASLKRQARSARPDASQGVPPAPASPLADFEPTLALRAWNREQGFVKPLSDLALADLYLCWDKQAVYVGLFAQDVVEDVCYRSKTVPEIDRAEWTVTVSGSGPSVRARIGAGAKPSVNPTSVQLVHLSGVNLSTRNIAALKLPAQWFGKSRLRAGDTVQLDSTFVGHCRGYRVNWKGAFTLRN